jgi:hypothetical protein
LDFESTHVCSHKLMWDKIAETLVSSYLIRNDPKLQTI